VSNERRTRRLCWIALGVLLPLALWVHAHEDFSKAWRAHASKPIDVGPKQTIAFAGMNWTVLDWAASENVKQPGTAEVIVRVQVDVTAQDAVKALGNCWPYLEDSSGQRWARRPPRSRETSCARLSLRADPQMKQAVLEERFLLPAARAAEVTLAFVIPKQQPRYLRFQRPAQ
jgi:hypothetical protein